MAWKPSDEERLGWEQAPAKRGWRVPRLRKVFVWLLLVDIFIVATVVSIFEPLITLLRRNEELFGARVELEQHEVSEPHPARHKIPRILHQTTANETIPDKWVLSQQSCREAYSDYEYMLWTDASAREFLAAEYPWFVDIWDNYPFVIQRADSIRYFVLHHYGGIYLDMDTLCNEPFPMAQIEGDGPDGEPVKHHALFKSTLPTGVTNDFMVASARHPAYRAAIFRLPAFYGLTRVWARLIPYCAIMISSGPFFLTMVVKDYLLAQPALPSQTIQVVNDTMLAPYITDLESSTWHKGDAQLLMWIGDRPWTWYAMGAMGLVAGLYVLNTLMLVVAKALRKVPPVTYNIKMAKLI